MKKVLKFVENVMSGFEVVIAILLLTVITVRVLEVVMNLFGSQIVLLNMDFDLILSISLTFIIGIEFAKMLCKQTPESVIDVLFFAIARQLVIYNDDALDLLIGVAAIAGLFAIKRYLINKRKSKDAAVDETADEIKVE